MKTQEVQFNGITYTCRVVESNEGEELQIGSTLLLDALHPGSFERTKVLPARKPNSFTTRYFSSQTKTPSICRTRS